MSALGWRGPEHRIYRACRSGVLQLATSPVLLNELRRVLAYPKLDLSDSEREAFVADVCSHALIVHPREELQLIDADPHDNRVLECAVTAGAQWIVTGDSHLTDLGSYESVRILTAREALELLGQPS